MISKTLFETLTKEWKNWIVTYLLLSIAFLFECYNNGISYAFSVIVAVIMFVVMVIVISDTIIFIFNRCRINKYWLVLLALCFIYYLVLNILGKNKAFVNLLQYAAVISIVLLIMIKLKYIFDKDR